MKADSDAGLSSIQNLSSPTLCGHSIEFARQAGWVKIS